MVTPVGGRVEEPIVLFHLRRSWRWSALGAACAPLAGPPARPRADIVALLAEVEADLATCRARWPDEPLTPALERLVGAARIWMAADARPTLRSPSLGRSGRLVVAQLGASLRGALGGRFLVALGLLVSTVLATRLLDPVVAARAFPILERRALLEGGAPLLSLGLAVALVGFVAAATTNVGGAVVVVAAGLHVGGLLAAFDTPAVVGSRPAAELDRLRLDLLLGSVPSLLALCACVACGWAAWRPTPAHAARDGEPGVLGYRLRPLGVAGLELAAALPFVAACTIAAGLGRGSPVAAALSSIVLAAAFAVVARLDALPTEG